MPAGDIYGSAPGTDVIEVTRRSSVNAVYLSFTSQIAALTAYSYKLNL